MNFIKPLLITLAVAALVGCGDSEIREREHKADPTFMFFNFRKEIVSEDYHVPDMKSDAAGTYLQGRLKTVPGLVESAYNLDRNVMTVTYKSSTVRKMNFEEVIAQSGFAVNRRPANPNAKLPAGVN